MSIHLQMIILYLPKLHNDPPVIKCDSCQREPERSNIENCAFIVCRESSLSNRLEVNCDRLLRIHLLDQLI
jgi:hypothetical protein